MTLLADISQSVWAFQKANGLPRSGSVDRWTNLPLLSTLDEVRARTEHARSVYFISWDFASGALIQALADRSARLVYQQGTTVIIEMQGASNPT